jgi:hypothetical protein
VHEHDNTYYIIRVVDPDDEFCETQWLTYGEDLASEYTWRNTLGADTVQMDRPTARRVLLAYRLGYEDAADRVRVPGLGS